MALLNLISARQPLVNSKNEPIRGGNVYLYEPGTTTFITGYQDSGLVTPHPNPVPISGSGRVNIWISRNCDLRIENKQGNLIVEELSVNPETLGQDEAGGLLANGSFEIDTNADNIPDSWVLVSEINSNNSIDTSQSTDGAQSFRFTSAGQGGGSLTTESFFPVNDVETLRINFDIRSTIATVQNIVRVEWSDISQVAISNTDIYDSTSNPTTFTSQNLTANPPANARFAKLRLIGCDPAVAVAGSTYFDRVSVFYPALVTGVFDNITIQNNEIISTNTNGNINITPNGTGTVVLQNTQSDLLRLTNADDVALASTAHALQIGPTSASNLAVGPSQIQSRNNGAARSLSINELGGDVRIGDSSATNIFIDSDGELSISRIGLTKLNTRSSGISLLGSLDNAVGGLQNTQIVLQNASGVDVGEFAYLGTANLRLRNLNHGGSITLEAEDSGGTLRTILEGDPDGVTTIRGDTDVSIQVLAGTESAIVCNGNSSVQIYFDNAIKIVTSSTGAAIRGSTNEAIGGNQDAALRFDNAGGTEIGFISYLSTPDLKVRNINHGGNVQLEAEDAGGVSRLLFVGNPDGTSSLYQAGSEVVRTATAAAGGLLANNTLTGAGFERALTVSDLDLRVVTTSDVSRTSTITPTADPELLITNIPTGIYKMDAFVLWQGSVNVFLRYFFDVVGNTGAFDSLQWYTDDAGSIESGIVGGFAVADGLVVLGPNPTDPQGRQGIKVSAVVDFTSTGSITFNWAQSVSSGQDVDRLTNSYMILTRLGDT